MLEHLSIQNYLFVRISDKVIGAENQQGSSTFVQKQKSNPSETTRRAPFKLKGWRYSPCRMATYGTT